MLSDKEVNEAKVKLRNFINAKKFLNTEEIYLESYCKKSLNDGQYDYFKKILKEEK